MSFANSQPVPEVGAAAPPISLPDAGGEIVTLGGFRGRWVVLYFYPKDDTPGCTTEAVEFSSRLSEFDAAGAVVLGISPDSCEKHAKFRDKHDLTVSLLADPDRAAIEAYGAWQLKKLYGKEYWGVQRSTFLIDPGGRIAHVWPRVRVKGHVDDVLKTVRARQGE